VIDDLFESLIPACPGREDILLATPRPHELVFANFQGAADRVAVKHGERTVTYGELGKMATSAAGELRKLGLESGAIVAAIGEPSIEMLATFLGTLHAGLAFCPVEHGPRMNGMLRELNPALIAVDRKNGHVSSGAKVLLFSDLACHPDPAPVTDDEPTLANRVALAYMRYRGEQTQTLSAITHFSLMTNYAVLEMALRRFLPDNKNEAVYPPPTLLSTTTAGQDWLIPLLFGGTLILDQPSRSNAQRIDELERLAREYGGVPIMAGVPTTLVARMEGVDPHPDTWLLAMDYILTKSQIKALTRVVTTVITDATLVWGHEDLWPEDIRKKCDVRPRWSRDMGN
jgi:acyl-CoA synthetase (AMP-forming)/AMP-acid ligase II